MQGIGKTSLLGSIARSRLCLLVATGFYAYAINYAQRTYLNPVWGYYGFNYREPGASDLAAIVCLLIVGSICLPTTIARPSSIVLLLLFVVVYVPTIVISFSLDTDRLSRYGPALALLSLGFVVTSVAARARVPIAADGGALPGKGFQSAIVVAWVVVGALLVAEYHSIMSFAGLSEIYEQRAAGASTNLFMGYAQTYFSNVLSPVLIVMGLMQARWRWVILGTAGCLLMFMIAAQRTVFIFPMVIVGIHLLVKSRSDFFRSTAVFVVALGAAVMLSVSYYDENAIASFCALFLVFRTLAVPGLAFSQYVDVFAHEGLTWWSHVRGLNLLIPSPRAYLDDHNWPSLGFMVGDRFYGNNALDANAHLFASDGAAAAGAAGVAVISVILAAWLRLLDQASIGWNRRFAVLVLVPVAMSLTNGQLSTTLLSFGGLFWTLVFHFYKPGRHAGTGGRKAGSRPL